MGRRRHAEQSADRILTTLRAGELRLAASVQAALGAIVAAQIAVINTLNIQIGCLSYLRCWEWLGHGSPNRMLCRPRPLVMVGVQRRWSVRA